MEKRFNYVYLIINKINGKCYIGSHGDNIKNDNYFGSGILIIQALNLYKKENFLKIKLKNYNFIIEARKNEEYYINLFDTLAPKGYNISPTGGCEKGFQGTTSEKTKKKISKSLKKIYKDPKRRKEISLRFKNKSYIKLYGEEKAQELKEKRKKNLNKYNPHKGKAGESNIHFGMKHSYETKRKMSKASKGKLKSEEHKRALSKAWEKRKIEKPHTKETLKKMSESMKGKNVGKYIKIYDFKGPDGKIYRTNEGIGKFAKFIKKDVRGLKGLIQKKRKEYQGWTYIKTIKE